MQTNHADLTELSDDELKDALFYVENELKETSNHKKHIVETIITRNNEALEDLLAAKDEPYGKVSLKGLDITYGKKVDYDQDKLALLAQQIAAAGEDPSEYIKVVYDVQEKKYNSWPTAIKKQFIDARTVSRGSPTVKIKGEKE